VAAQLSRQIEDLGIDVTILESDALRKLFATQPQYDDQGREYFYASLAFIGRVLVERGISVIFDATANRRKYRDQGRQTIQRFVEVFVECPLETCMRRDPKGIYRKARDGEASHVPGIQAEYEPPETPDLVVRGDRDDPADAARNVIDLLVQKGYVHPV
jgi:adenylylsulfate kinase